jgi:hypothetical protein
MTAIKFILLSWKRSRIMRTDCDAIQGLQYTRRCEWLLERGRAIRLRRRIVPKQTPLAAVFSCYLAILSPTLPRSPFRLEYPNTSKLNLRLLYVKFCDLFAGLPFSELQRKEIDTNIPQTISKKSFNFMTINSYRALYVIYAVKDSNRRYSWHT